MSTDQQALIPESTPAVAEPPPLVVDVTTAAPDDRLAVLYAAYPEAKAEADEAAKRLRAITDGIKLELTTRAPEGTAKLELKGQGGTPLRLAWQVTRRFDTRLFQRDQPDVYDSYRKDSGSWVLAPIKGGE